MGAAYAELHCHSHFSFLDGTSSPDALAARAGAAGLRALALTDHDNLSGLVRFALACRRHAVPAIVGAEVTLAGGAHAVLLVTGADGYRNLCRVLTHARMHSPKDAPELPFGVLADHAAGLIALSACDRGELRRALGTGGEAAARAVAHRYRDAFGRDGYVVELHNHLRQADGPRNAALARVAAAAGVGIVATNNAHYATPDRALLHHVVTAVRHRTTLEEAGDLLRPNDENYLKTPAQMARLFAGYPEALRATLGIAERCRFGLADLRYRFPSPEVPPGETPSSWLVTCVEEGRRRFYPDADAAVLARLAHELEIVRRLDLAGYLLVFKDIVDYCWRAGILVSIRGSAPASALLYCLGLCPIDPVRHNLVFERFASLERDELPDIDLDIEHERREEVIQYVYSKYGRTHAAMVCEVNTYRLKSAVRDVAKALGVPHQEALRLSTSIDERDPPDGLVAAAEGPAVTGVGHPRDSTTRVARLAADRAASGATAAPAPPPAERSAVTGLLAPLVRQLLDSPRHLSIHVGGFVVSARPLSDVLPIEPARMPGRSIIPWDKDDLTLLAEEFGVNLVKMDLLGLGMLSLVSRCFRLIEAERGQRLDLHGFAYDPGVFDLLCSADTVGLFQVESRAQMAFLPQLRPRNLQDVAISVGAIRPGPGACQAGKHIALRRLGRERVTYPAPELKPVLEETLGVVLWQEQVMQVAMVIAGYTGGEADRLRRAMSSKHSAAGMAAASRDLVDRIVARGHPRKLAEDLKKMIAGFAGYGFPRAHAYPFAHLALVSATLKLRYPAAFYASLLNAQPMGFYAPHTIVWDARRHGVRVLPVDVNASAWESTVVDARTIRLGLKQVDGLGPAARAAIEPARADGPFGSLAEVVARTGLARDDLEALAGVGAFLGFADRRAAFWEVGELAGLSGPRYLPGLAPLVAEHADLPAMSGWEETRADYAGLGFSVDRHVVEYFRPALRATRARSAAELPGLPKNLVVRVGGLVITRQRPETARGFTFLTIEDETGLVNVIVAPAVYQRQRALVRAEPLLVVEGVLQKDDAPPQGGAINVIARRFWPLRSDAAAAEAAARVPSHDFR